MARGDITKSAGMGKKIDSFPYDIDQQIDGRVVSGKASIAVYMSKDFGMSDTTPKPVTGVEFRCRADGVDDCTGSDLQSVLKAMRSKLDLKYKINWMRYLKVQVSQRNPYYGAGTGMTLEWSEVYRGVTVDGDVLMRSYARGGTKTWNIEPWPQSFKDQRGNTLACIPSTDENEAALEAFKEKIDAMRTALANFVSPENIDATLRQIQSGELRLLTHK